jgi:putative oxygen-independent coproporphyrinogen III oxidase
MSMLEMVTRMGRWTPDPGFGVYVHIPFCKHRCHYCDFNTYEGLGSLHDAYVDALVADIHRSQHGRPATSVFFGGGTPTLLTPQQLGRILRAIEATSGIAPGAEITVEANPETVDERVFAGLLEAGFNRVSIGVQSLVPRVLLGLGRTHSPERALDAIAAARRAGVEDVNADLIYGSPWETDDDWNVSLDGVIAAAPDHVSAYALTVEEGTPLATLVATGRVPEVDPDLQARRHAVASQALSAAGYERYEVSNWAKPGRASAHNVLYWCAGDYLGFGAGAHGHVAGRRYWVTRLPRDFITAVAEGGSTTAGDELVHERAGEALMLGMRLASGVDLHAFAERFGERSIAGRQAAITRLERDGLIERDEGWIRMTERGTMLGNEVGSSLL